MPLFTFESFESRNIRDFRNAELTSRTDELDAPFSNFAK
jgi:hypothetical protein